MRTRHENVNECNGVYIRSEREREREARERNSDLFIFFHVSFIVLLRISSNIYLFKNLEE